MHGRSRRMRAYLVLTACAAAGITVVAPASVAPGNDSPYDSGAAVGYIAIDGTDALVGTTGKFCTPGQSPECFTNTDPAAVFSSGKTFDQLWQDAGANKSDNTYSLTVLIEIGGKWYIN